MYDNPIIGNAIALLVALGGFEFIKYIISFAAHRRKENAQAKQEESIAGQNDADLRQKELDLMNGIIATTKAQYDDLRVNYEEIRTNYEGIRASYDELVKQAKMDAYNIAQNDRRIRGLENAFKREVAKKMDAERHYCGDEICAKRQPALGTYHTETIDIYKERDQRGRFVKQRAS